MNENPRGRNPNRQAQPNPPRAPSEGSVRPRRNREQDEERLGKLKFIMPKFKGEQNPDAYIDWELKVEKIFRIHNYSEEKKVAMASLEFENYANILWEEIKSKS